MPPRLVHLVRHADRHRHLTDPSLTDRGHEECVALAANFPYHFTITKILCSPLKRAIQTTLESFYPAISALSGSNPQWHIDNDPYLISRGTKPPVFTIPEIKQSLEESVKENPKLRGYEYTKLLDFSRVESEMPRWPEKEGIFLPDNIIARGVAARRYIYDNYDLNEELLVVTHGGFINYLTDEWDGFDECTSTSTGWTNADWRSYNMLEENGAIRFAETEESIRHRMKRTDVGCE
ncbi:hypothetical protein ABW20_dc0105127 [Dactylellina cionopaga]|nr:hypothetical protein ABW20_dc0105127 [Dactylellina cionopaga]